VALLWADPPSKEPYRLCKIDYETEEEARAQQNAIESLMNEWIQLVHETFWISAYFGNLDACADKNFILNPARFSATNDNIG
jgi:hypothetical protein